MHKIDGKIKEMRNTLGRDQSKEVSQDDHLGSTAFPFDWMNVSRSFHVGCASMLLNYKPPLSTF
jgi:hypothetical protein